MKCVIISNKYYTRMLSTYMRTLWRKFKSNIFQLISLLIFFRKNYREYTHICTLQIMDTEYSIIKKYYIKYTKPAVKTALCINT